MKTINDSTLQDVNGGSVTTAVTTSAATGAGAAIGTAIAGPAGGVIGAAIGAGVGTAAGEAIDTHKSEINHVVGGALLHAGMENMAKK